MGSWFDTQVQNLRNKIPFVSPSLLSFIDTVIYNERGDFNKGGILDEHFKRDVVFMCHYRPDVASRRWYTLSWVESDDSRLEVSAQKYDLLLWRAIQAHINVQEQENPKKHAYIDSECAECALAGKPLKPYFNNGHYYGHHCDEHMPKEK